MPSLAATQELLRRLITAPEGVAATLAGDADGGGDLRRALAGTIPGGGGLDAVQRLDVYANMYFFRLLGVLQEYYPATRAVVGDVEFHNLVTGYLLRHPPAHFSVRHAGALLPEFIDSAAPIRPYLGELARLERAINDAFDAEDQPALTADDLKHVPAEDWGAMRLRLQASVHLLRGAWAVQTVREQTDRGEPAAAPTALATALCVARQNLRVSHRVLDVDEFEALRLVQQGAPFEQICSASAAAPDVQQGVQRVAAWLAGWLARGWLATPTN